MIQPELKIDKYLIEITDGNDMVRLVEGLDELNRTRDKNHLPMLYTADKEERQDPVIGSYSVLVVSKFGLNTSDPTIPTRIAEYTPVDKDGNIIRESHQMARHASITLEAKRIQHFQELRNIQLKAAAINDVKFDFVEGIKLPARTHKVGDAEVKTDGVKLTHG